MKLLGLMAVGLCACGSSTTALNNCTTFSDHSAATDAREVDFGGTLGLVYSPACMEIAAGQTVTFSGDFSTHPLAPGTGPTASGAGSPNNPIATPAPTAATAPFTFPTAGTYPFYCKVHVGSGMAGVIKVH
jgi:plastocyanin